MTVACVARAFRARAAAAVAAAVAAADAVAAAPLHEHKSVYAPYK